jgi:hypothetical protein
MRQLTYQRGIALPIMLIMLAVMMVSSIYLLKSSTSSTLTTSNLAYEAALTKAADAGLHRLHLPAHHPQQEPAADRPGGGRLRGDAAADLDRQQSQLLAGRDHHAGRQRRQPGAVRDPPHVHAAAAYDDPTNRCQTTAPRPAPPARARGETLKIDASNLAVAAQIHYVVTARVFGRAAAMW